MRRRPRLFRAALALWLVLQAGLPIAQDSVRPITILHVNDVHARFLPDARDRGGFARIAAVLRRERAASPGALVLDGGDLVQGTPVSTIYQGVPVFEVANLLGIDAMSLGNHEFDYGWRKIREFMRTAEFPIVCANVFNRRGRLLAEAPYVIREVNGIRVAVIGLLTADLPYLAPQDKIGPWRAFPVVEVVRRNVKEVRQRSDLVVVLGHLVDAEEQALLREVPEVSVIVAGHGHEGLREPIELDGRLVVRVQAYGREVGRLDLQVDTASKSATSARWKRIPIDGSVNPLAEDVAAAVAAWEAKVAARVDVPIGEATREIDEAELKALIERAMVETLGVDLAYVNPGGIRDVLPRGPLLARHVWNVMPFDEHVVIGRFEGRRLPPVVSAGIEIDPEREYRLATIDFVASMWERHGPRGLDFPERGPNLRELILAWVRERRVIGGDAEGVSPDGGTRRPRPQAPTPG